MSEPKLLMPFIDESPSFVLGFECGQIWQQMQDKKELRNYLFHTDNIKQVEMICHRHLVVFEIKMIDETWSELNIENFNLN